MKTRFSLSLIAMAIVAFFSNSINSFSADAGNGFSIETQSFLSYQTPDKVGGLDGGAFSVNRSYLTIKKQVLDNLVFRITLDSYSDASANMNMRLKYVYAQFKFSDFGFITKPNLEVGLSHTPWLDFEEHLNLYRMQGSMFMERVGLFSSADFGLTFGGLFGGELDDNYKKTVNKNYAGRYGSYAIGIYNGGGYHAAELTGNKSFQARVSIRPIPDILPGLQVSYLGIFGKGNKNYGSASSDSIPDWNSNTAMLSYESDILTLTGQFISGKGNSAGSNIASGYDAAAVSGYSAFAEIKPISNLKIIGRYDAFDPNTDKDNDNYTRFIAGIGWDFGHHNVLLLDYDSKKYNSNANKADENLFKVTMQVEF